MKGLCKNLTLFYTIFAISVFAQKTILTLPVKHTLPITKLIFTSDRRYIFTASEDNEIKLWYFPSSDLIKTFRGHNKTITSIIVDKATKHLISTDKDGILNLWDVYNGNIIKSLKFNEPIETANLNELDGILSLSLATGKLIFLKFPDLQVIKEISTSPYSAISILKGKEAGIYYLGFKKATNETTNILQKGNVQIYDYQSNLFFPLCTYNDDLASLILSPDSTKIISASSENYTIRLWDTRRQLEDVNFKVPYKPGILFCSRTNKMIGVASAENDMLKIYRNTGDEIMSAHIDTGIIIFGEINKDITRIHICNQYGQFRYYDFEFNIRESYGNFTSTNKTITSTAYDEKTKSLVLGLITGEVAIMKLYDSLAIQTIDTFQMPVESIHTYNGKAIIHWKPHITISDDKNLYQTYTQSKIDIIDIAKQKVIYTKTYNDKYICSSSLNNNYFFLGFNNGTIEIINHNDFSVFTTKQISPYDIIQIKAFNNQLYITTIQPEVLIYEIANQKQPLIFKGKQNLNNNEILLSLNHNVMITNQHILYNNNIIHTNKITDAQITNKQIFLLKNDTISLFDVSNQSTIWNKPLEKKYHQLLLDSVHQFLILVNYNQDYQFINTKNGDEICKLYLNNNTQWLCEANDNFDISTGLLSKVHFVKGILFDKNYNIYDYYKPKLLQQKLFSLP